MNDDLEQHLVEAASQACRQAHAPYSGIQVGAALQTEGGVYLGSNVENASFGLTVCAERVAVFNAIAGGHRGFEMLAVASPGGLPPCGACRQVLAEFCTDLPILLVDAERGELVARTSLNALLPDRFEYPTG